MNEFSFKDFSDWNIYDGASEGSGRSEKVWLISPSREYGLSQDHHFKWWFENSPKRAAYIAA